MLTETRVQAVLPDSRQISLLGSSGVAVKRCGSEIWYRCSLSKCKDKLAECLVLVAHSNTVATRLATWLGGGTVGVWDTFDSISSYFGSDAGVPSWPSRSAVRRKLQHYCTDVTLWKRLPPKERISHWNCTPQSGLSFVSCMLKVWVVAPLSFSFPPAKRPIVSHKSLLLIPFVQHFAPARLQIKASLAFSSS